MELKDRKTEAADRLADAATLARAGDYRKALAALEIVLDLDPELAEAYFIRGFCHYMSGHYRHAANDFDAATLLGCHTAQMWSRFESAQAEDQTDGNGEDGI